jgi:hypothetical protein
MRWVAFLHTWGWYFIPTFTLFVYGHGEFNLYAQWLCFSVGLCYEKGN